MARTENTTKAIACRVPMSDYINFLTEASRKNMSLSEWLLVKIYSPQSSKVKLKASNGSTEATVKEVEKLKKEVQNLTRERDLLLSRENKPIQELREENESLQDKIYQVYKYAKTPNVTAGEVSDFIFSIFHLPYDLDTQE